MVSHRGEARPPFDCDIFAEDQWWLTDLLRRPKKEEADEDGPPTESDAPVDDEEDSDPMSNAEEVEDHAQIPEGYLGSCRALGRAVHIGWRSRKRARESGDAPGVDDAARSAAKGSDAALGFQRPTLPLQDTLAESPRIAAYKHKVAGRVRWAFFGWGGWK